MHISLNELYNAFLYLKYVTYTVRIVVRALIVTSLYFLSILA